MTALRFTELASLFILALGAALQSRAGRGALGRFLADAAAIGASAWLAEDLCIRWFGFYGYAGGWTLRLDRVPLLIGVIWPYVVLSARDVARAASAPGPLSTAGLALRAGALICFDAALVEPVAVRSGLWSWAEPGIHGVPPIGLAGWGVFGAVCVAWLDLAERWRRPWLRWLLPLVAPPLANGLLVALWWGGLRWVLRGPWSDGLSLGAALAASAAFLVAARGRRGAAGLPVMIPRAAAALLFFGLLAWRFEPHLGLYALCFAPPYLWLMRWSASPTGSGESPRPQAPSRKPRAEPA